MALSSCSYMIGGPEISLSPDSTLAAYLCARQWDLPLPPECPTIRSRIWVRWCTLERPQDYRDVEIGVFGKDWGGWFVTSRIHYAFSPDSRHLAAASPRDLRVIDCATGTWRTLTGPAEVVTSFIWLDDSELAYASCQIGTDEQRKSNTHFWRQGIDQSSHERRLIFAEDSGSCPQKGLGTIGWPRERWSPDGAYVIYMAQGFQGDLKLLDVASRAAAVIAPRDHNFEGIAWKSDSSEAVCVGSKRGFPARAFLINPRTLEKHDFSDQFNTYFDGDSEHYPPQIALKWTAGDQYFIANHSRKGGCLVNPLPWKVTPLARLLIDRIVREGTMVLSEDQRVRLPWIFWQPAKGWVSASVAFQEKGYVRGREYLVDYSGRFFVALDQSSASAGRWTVTRDGKRAVMLAHPDTLIVRELSLPSLGTQ
ncbi:MAG: TolB family protein [Thermodesulfobacteriota bacterium]